MDLNENDTIIITYKKIKIYHKSTISEGAITEKQNFTEIDIPINTSSNILKESSNLNKRKLTY